MIGAIAGDIIGSTYEILNTKDKNFNLYRPLSRYTDDTVLTVATADCILKDGNFGEYYRNYCLNNPLRGYGTKFSIWAILNKKEAYYSMGNGSAMRVSPVGFMANSLDQALYLAEKTAIVTHNHPEGIKGAKAVVSTIYLCRLGWSKEDIKEYIEATFGYDLSISYNKLKSIYKGGGTCPDSVPEAIIAFLYSTDYEDAIRNAISIGGDSDTIACITGGIAEAYYKEIPQYILDNTFKRLNPKFIEVIKEFQAKYMK